MKGVGEQHEFQVSKVPVSYEDLHSAFERLLDGVTGTDIFDYREGDVRQRRYLQYEVMEPEHLYEYVTTGHAWDDRAMTATGQEYVQQ